MLQFDICRNPCDFGLVETMVFRPCVLARPFAVRVRARNARELNLWTSGARWTFNHGLGGKKRRAIGFIFGWRVALVDLVANGSNLWNSPEVALGSCN